MICRSSRRMRWPRCVALGAAIAAATAGPARALSPQATGSLTQRSVMSVGIAPENLTDSVAAPSPATADNAAAGARPPNKVDLITAATREYQRTGVARTVEEGAFVTFPFGHVQPTVTCAPLRACVIELQSGETVLSKIAGDTQRWEIQLAPAGVDGRTPLIVVKPHDCALTTNLVLATTAGRIYDLTLDSPPCPRAAGGANPQGAYVRHVRFYYPDAMVQAWTTAAFVPAAASGGGVASTGVSNVASATTAARVDAFNFEYRLHRDHGFPWSPLAVFDDGAHCYIKLPALAAHRDAPVLFVMRDDGTKALLNYSVSGDTYVTDRVFRAAVLVIGDGNQERSVRIENLRYEAPMEPEHGGDSGAAVPSAGGSPG